ASPPFQSGNRRAQTSPDRPHGPARIARPSRRPQPPPAPPAHHRPLPSQPLASHRDGPFHPPSPASFGSQRRPLFHQRRRLAHPPLQSRRPAPHQRRLRQSPPGGLRVEAKVH